MILLKKQGYKTNFRLFSLFQSFLIFIVFSGDESVRPTNYKR